MNKSIYDYQDYRRYLNDWVAAQKNHGHGMRLKFSKAVKCHTAYITLVLGGKSDFTLEQGTLISEFIGHDSGEKHFFLLMIQYERAGSVAVRTYFKTQMDEVLEEKRNLKNRLTFKKTLTRENQSIYYSSWHYAAIHMVISSPLHQTKTEIAQYFDLPLHRVGQILKFLVSVGLAEERGHKFVLGTATLHLEQDSPMISKHHSNWRMQAIQSLDRDAAHDLHYSSVTMISEKDAETIRRVLVNAIEEVRKNVKESKEEVCYAYGLDLFRMGRNS